MRIQLISDLHVDVRAGYVPEVADGVDVVVVAGDVCEGIQDGMAFLRAHIPATVPVVMVAGNHEFYHRAIKDERVAAAGWAREHNIRFLDDGAATIDGVRFVGATLWTDFALYGAMSRGHSMTLVGEALADFRCILNEEGSKAIFSPKDAAALHRASVAAIGRELETPHDGPAVVVTHHAPHPGSVDPRFAGDVLTPGFVSDLSPFIERHQPRFWLHGHVHSSFDYLVGATRVVCNPKGYGRENRMFDPALVIDV